jgi:hypothetical protein
MEQCSGLINQSRVSDVQRRLPVGGGLVTIDDRVYLYLRIVVS